MQEQHHIGLPDLGPGACDTHLFDLIVAVAQPGGINNMQWDTFDLYRLLHLVPRSTWDG